MFNKFKDKFEGVREKAEQTVTESRERLSKTYSDVSSQIQERINEEPPDTIEAWCSWCGEYEKHSLMEPSKIGRSSYECDGCNFPTITCRYCDNMAKGASSFVRSSEMDNESTGRISTIFKDHWNNELCSEHDGSIPDFSRANETIEDLSAFKNLMTPKRTNLYGAAKKTAAVAAGSGALLAAPGIAVALGAAGTLGAAGLSGAATSKVGFGGLVMATKAGLGGRTGFGIANSYLKDVTDFEFSALREIETSTSHSIVVVDGFLSEEEKNQQDWLTGLTDYKPQDQLWHLNWEAKSLRKLGQWGFGTATGASSVAGGIATGSQKIMGTASPMGLAQTASSLINNPWHSAMVNAEKTGALLAEAITRTEGKTYTLVGHSLGARVVYFALLALATKEKAYVEDAILLGAAVGRDDFEEWLKPDLAVNGSIFNCYSENDQVLRYLYQGANLGLSNPAGLAHVNGIVHNLDCSDLIDSHTSWKEKFSTVTERISAAKQND